MAEHEIGLHWLRHHPDDNADLSHIRKFGYKSVKVFEWMWNNQDFCTNLVNSVPGDCIFLARDHPLSEQHSDLARDAVGTGIRHADEWQQKIDQGRFFLPLDRTYFLGINEPDDGSGNRPIEESNAARDRLDDYTAAFADRTRTHGRRIGAFNFATGKPRSFDNTPNTPPDWDYYKKRKSYHAIKAGNHIVVFHVYGSAGVPLAPGHYDRIAYCDWVDILFMAGECGIDEHVTTGGDHNGWLHPAALNGNAQSYAAWLDKFIAEIKRIAKVKIHSWQIFTFDFSQPWWSMDTRTAANVFENYLWQHIKVGPQTTPTNPPPPVEENGVMYINAPSGLNIRSGPGTIFPKVGALPYGTRVTVIGSTQEWAKIGPDQWLTREYLQAQPLTVAPVIDDGPTEPDESDLTWEWAYRFVEKWEGSYQNNPDDSGNWTGCEIGKGINKGTNFGISACSYPDLDIVSLTKQQAKNIFYRDYFVASGAHLLPKEQALLVFDTAVLHGVNAAKKWFNEVGANPYEFAARRLEVYVNHPKWAVFGRAWVKRVADLLDEVGG